MMRFASEHWAIILGASSGMGLATAKKLAQHGMNICAVHRDRRAHAARIDADFAEIRAYGVQCLPFNVDALDAEVRKNVLDNLTGVLGAKGKVRTFLHSIAFGNLKPIAPALVVDASKQELLLDDEDMARTIYSMGTNLLSWVQDLHRRKLFASDARVFGLTSEGNEVAWKGYAAVSAAKLAMESLARSIACEFAVHGIRCNIVQPGVTDTPALRLIPGNEAMLTAALKRNPFKRLTRPEDVANLLFLLSTDEASWVNGALIRVDGGEKISGL